VGRKLLESTWFRISRTKMQH